MKEHEDALVCDLAEYYGIYDYRQFSLRYIATLAVGLRADSRVKGYINGIEQPPVGITLVQMLDAIQYFAYAMAGGKEAPKSALNAYLTAKKTTDGYDTGEDFENAREAILGRIKDKRKWHNTK